MIGDLEGDQIACGLGTGFASETDNHVSGRGSSKATVSGDGQLLTKGVGCGCGCGRVVLADLQHVGDASFTGHVGHLECVGRGEVVRAVAVEVAITQQAQVRAEGRCLRQSGGALGHKGARQVCTGHGLSADGNGLAAIIGAEIDAVRWHYLPSLNSSLMS